MKICQWCGDVLVFVLGRGWLHKSTDSVYTMKCGDCYYRGESAMRCPKCGSKDYVDDHCALPVERADKKI